MFLGNKDWITVKHFYIARKLREVSALSEKGHRHSFSSCAIFSQQTSAALIFSVCKDHLLSLSVDSFMKSYNIGGHSK